MFFPIAAATVSTVYKEEPTIPVGSPEFYQAVLISAFLVLAGGLLSGLTLGLVSQDETHLEVLKKSSNDIIRYRAHRISKLIQGRKHWILVTLLLGNTIINEALPMVLDRVLGSGPKAVLIATSLIFVFGEIIPQAVCAKYGLAVGSALANLVRFLMYALFPVGYPAAALLDWMLGNDHGFHYHKAELKALVQIHRAEGDTGSLLEDEVQIIQSVLDLHDKLVKEVMTPITRLYTLKADQILDRKITHEILFEGYSRIPVTNSKETGFLGFLLVKRLITYDPSNRWPVMKFPLQHLPEVPSNASCLDLLNFFQEGKSHIALVTEENVWETGRKIYLGVITLEDIIEELIGEEIMDETDNPDDVHQAKRKSLERPIFPGQEPTRTNSMQYHTTYGATESFGAEEEPPPHLSTSHNENKPLFRKLSLTKSPHLKSPLLGAMKGLKPSSSSTASPTRGNGATSKGNAIITPSDAEVSVVVSAPGELEQ